MFQNSFSKKEKRDLFFRSGLAIPILVIVILAAGCIQQEKPVTELKISGHPQIYSFSSDLREALKVPATGQMEMQTMFSSSDRIDIVFNGTSTQDNAYFRVVLINIVSKLQTYSVNEGKILEFDTYYFVDGVWYNATNNEIEKPDFGAAIWLKGPDTGATETSVRIEGNIVTVPGTFYKNLTLAGDKFVLVVFGIDKI